jgi:multiple sugar transport system permease protein
MLTPALALLALLIVLPVLLTPIFSFFHVDLFGGVISFVGTQNWAAEVANGELITGTANTLGYALLTVPTSLALGMCCALAIDRVRFARSFWRTAFFLPAAATLAAMAVAWKAMMAPGGPFDALVGDISGVSDWLSDYRLALPAIAIVGVWQQFGYNTVLFAAGLSTLPREPMEASILDGVNAWQRFWRIMLPMMGPSVVFAIVTSTMTALKAFDQIQVMTGGGPGDSTRTLPLMIYSRGMSYLDIGGGAVLATAMLAIVMLVTVWQVRRLRHLEESGTSR